jgi:omega-6 fatty acid desaturase (delta-12 desaturase)
MHRCYRSETGLGLGLHYIVEIWVPRMLYPTRAREGRRRRNLFRDTAALHVMLAGVGFGAYRFAVFCDERRADDLGYWLTSALFVVVLPLLGTHWLIGFVIYLNHTHPNIVWYDDPAMWGSRDVQLECSADVVLRSAMPQRIMHHTAHHVNTRVPLRRLADAQQRLIDDGDGQVTSYRWSRREFVAVLRACKLYDYEAREWLGFDGVPTAPVTVQHGGVQ